MTDTLKSIILCSIVGLLFLPQGCVQWSPTQPNAPYFGPYPQQFRQLEKKNPALAAELARLPEFADGVDAQESNGLIRFSEFYLGNQKSTDDVFIEMQKIGLPTHRRYLSPLQAFYWIFLDNQDHGDKVAEDILRFYSLHYLLDKAWRFEQVVLTKEQAGQIRDSIANTSIRDDYTKDLQKNDLRRMQLIVFLDHKIRKEIFTTETQSRIEELKKQSINNPRWDDFTIVTERLNAPELIDYYQRRRFHYRDWRTLPEPVVSPQYVFRHNHGECVSITRFTIYCLKIAGYWAREIRVSPTDSQYPYHAVCLFIQGAQKMVMDNGRISMVGIVPYTGSSYERSAQFTW